MRLNAKELRDLEEEKVTGQFREIKRNPIYFILENIYDTYNIGGLFRLADALAIEKMYLCGDSEIPPNPRIKKASIGTYKVVPWEYRKSAKEVIHKLKDDSPEILSRLNSSLPLVKQKVSKNFGSSSFSHSTSESIKSTCQVKIVAVEQDKTAINYQKAHYSLPIALLFGNETYGVLPETLKLADQIVEIPMWGINRSLNVIVSAAIVSYWISPVVLL